jgi:hypothetical protein
MQTPHRAQRVSTIDTDLATTRGVRRVRHARSIWQPIWALLAASVLVASGCQREDTPKNTAPLAETPARAPFDAHLTLANNGGRIDYSGEVDTAAAETALEDALRKAYSGDRATGVIDVVTAARPSAWATGLEPLLRAFEPAYGAALRFEGDRIVLSGQADEATRAKLREAARLAFPNAILDGLLAETAKSRRGQADPRVESNAGAL